MGFWLARSLGSSFCSSSLGPGLSSSGPPGLASSGLSGSLDLSSDSSVFLSSSPPRQTLVLVSSDRDSGSI